MTLQKVSARASADLNMNGPQLSLVWEIVSCFRKGMKKSMALQHHNNMLNNILQFQLKMEKMEKYLVSKGAFKKVY